MDIRDHYLFDVSCQGSVPQSLIAFLESTGYEDAVLNAISLGGDADTIACIAGSVAEAFYGAVPNNHRHRSGSASTNRCGQLSASSMSDSRIVSTVPNPFRDSLGVGSIKWPSTNRVGPFQEPPFMSSDPWFQSLFAERVGGFN